MELAEIAAKAGAHWRGSFRRPGLLCLVDTPPVTGVTELPPVTVVAYQARAGVSARHRVIAEASIHRLVLARGPARTFEPDECADAFTVDPRATISGRSLVVKAELNKRPVQASMPGDPHEVRSSVVVLRIPPGEINLCRVRVEEESTPIVVVPKPEVVVRV